ncbi:MAG: PEGA domain-containing protein [Verrucomicrobia bacterium]|nr:MAG: PEGA domain-containing protein [Verrucomicrobiota bacterium]
MPTRIHRGFLLGLNSTLLALLVAFTPNVKAADALRKAAIIVENRAGKELNDKVQVLEDLLATRISGEGFTILSRDVVTRSLKDYSAGGDSGPTALDRALETNTSALRLAQNLGVDYIIIPSITTYGHEKKTYKGNGVNTINDLYTLRVGYKIVEAGEGGSIRGGMATANKTVRGSDGLGTETTEHVNEMLDDAATQIAAELIKSGKGANALPTAVAQAKSVSFSVACSMTDIKDQPIAVPDVQISKDNKVVKSDKPIEVQALDVTVELDGLTIGSAPGSFQAKPGLHKLRLSREGFNPWERTINVVDGQKLKVALQMSDKGYARWKDNVQFLDDIKNGDKLTDAQVKVMEGYAKFWSESHYRVDTKEGIHIHKSLY